MRRLRSIAGHLGLAASFLFMFAFSQATLADGPQYESPEIGAAIELLRQKGATVSFYPTRFNPFGNGGVDSESIAYAVNIHSLKPTHETLSALLVIPKVDRLSLGANFQRDQIAWDTLVQMSEVESLAIHGDLQKYDLENVARYPNLTQLSITRAQNLQPEHLWHLEEATQLTRLTLSIEGECGPYFDYLARLPRIRDLSLSLPADRSVSLAGVEKLDQLSSLNIDSQQVRGNDLRSIGKLRHLDSLSLMRTFLSREEMELFRPLDRLTSLTLYDCHFQDNPVDSLEGLTGLVRVHFSSNEMSEEVLKPLGKLPRIRQIYIRGSNITDEGLTYLHGARTLNTLQLDSASITPEGIAAIRKAIPSINVILPRNN